MVTIYTFPDWSDSLLIIVNGIDSIRVIVVVVVVVAVTNLLHNLWSELSAALQEVASHACRVFAQQLSVDVLCHKVRGVLGAKDLVQRKLFAPQSLLQPQAVTLEVPQFS